MLLLALGLAVVLFGRMLESEQHSRVTREYIVHRNEINQQHIPLCVTMPPDLGTHRKLKDIPDPDPTAVDEVIDLKSEQFSRVPQEYIVHRNETEQQHIPLCDPTPPDLNPNPIEVDTSVDIFDLSDKFPEIHFNGWYSPPHCMAQHSVAIIVPYRGNSLKQLVIFLNHMHPFLMKQQIEYRIFIIEQKGVHDINRGKLLNVGFVESQKWKAGEQCFIFHDIDLLPLDQRIPYSCPHPVYPRHMAVAIDKNNFSVSYDTYFGGVTALTLEQFIKVNGFSNRYWSWGGEDDDLYNRLTHMNYTIARYDRSIARYASLEQAQGTPDPLRFISNGPRIGPRYDWFNLVMDARSSMRNDGLSTLNYTLVSVSPHRLYTHLVVNIGRSPIYYQMLKILKKYHSGLKQSDLDRIKEEFAAMF